MRHVYFLGHVVSSGEGGGEFYTSGLCWALSTEIHTHKKFVVLSYPSETLRRVSCKKKKIILREPFLGLKIPLRGENTA